MTKSAGIACCWTLIGLWFMSFELGCSKGATTKGTPDTYPQFAWPAELSQHVATALDVSRQSWSVGIQDREAWERLRARFDSELDAIAAFTDDGLLARARVAEGDDSTAKLVLIASYRRSHEERIHSIAERFHFDGPPTDSDRTPTDWGRRRHVPPQPPQVTEAWAHPGDRLAWEYLLLRPSPRHGPSTLFRMRAIAALDVIGDATSAVTLVLCIRLATTSPDGPPDKMSAYLKVFVSRLFFTPSTASLEALLEFPTWIEEAPVFAVAAQDGLDGGARKEVEELQNHPTSLIQRAMQRATRNEGVIQGREERRRRWLQLIDSYAPTAPPERKTQLMKLRAALLLEPLPGRPRHGTVKE